VKGGAPESKARRIDLGTNLEIIRQLTDGRRSFRAIADDLGIAENTVRSRVKELRASGAMHITSLVDPSKLSNHTLVIIGVKLNTTNNLMQKCHEFRRLSGVAAAAVVTGRYHLIIVVLLNESLSLLDFYEHEVSTIECVVDCETFAVYGNDNFLVPYVLPALPVERERDSGR
jgi:Lrp/AsnC family transcriptional regulator for asnA, asnC and gidA